MTLTADCAITDEQIRAIARDLRTFGRMRLRVNHECAGTWFTHNRRYSYREVGDFFVRFAKIVETRFRDKHRAPDVRIEYACVIVVRRIRKQHLRKRNAGTVDQNGDRSETRVYRLQKRLHRIGVRNVRLRAKVGRTVFKRSGGIERTSFVGMIAKRYGITVCSEHLCNRGADAAGRAGNQSNLHERSPFKFRDCIIASNASINESESRFKSVKK